MTKTTNKLQKGSVSIELINDSYRLRFRHLGKRYALGVGRNETKAKQTALQIELDIISNNFDPSLEKYGKSKKHSPERKYLENLAEIWDLYYQHRVSQGAKQKTIKATYDHIGRKILACPYKTLKSSAKIVKWVSQQNGSRKLMMYISAACKYALKLQLIESNPFDGIYSEMKRPKYMDDPDPRPLTDKEVNELFEKLASYQSELNPLYEQFMRFMLLTGCRPCEAVGIQWRDIKPDRIHFCRNITQYAGDYIFNDSTKNNNSRVFPLYPELMELIEEMDRGNGTDLIFSPDGKNPLNYSNFGRRVWKRVGPEETTAYNLRDTFITRQLIKGISATIIASWVGNSTATIERYYAQKSVLALSVMPSA
jgi:integrase